MATLIHLLHTFIYFGLLVEHMSREISPLKISQPEISAQETSPHCLLATEIFATLSFTAWYFHHVKFRCHEFNRRKFRLVNSGAIWGVQGDALPPPPQGIWVIYFFGSVLDDDSQTPGIFLRRGSVNRQLGKSLFFLMLLFGN